MTEHEIGERPPATVAALEHLTGPSRGSVSWLSESALDVILAPGRHIRVASARPGEPRENLVARLHRSGDTYEIEAPEGRALWVNRSPVSAKRLANCDMIEFGEVGPLSRFRLHGDSMPVRKSIPDIICDCIDYLRVSRLPVRRRITRASQALVRQLTHETTIFFRIAVIVAIVVMAALAYQQYRFNLALQQSLEAGAYRLDAISAALARAREEALRPGDLAELRSEIGQRVTSSIERLEALEQRSRATADVIAASMASVALLQGSYGFRDRATDRMLRHVVNDQGIPLISPRGQPLLSLEGDGPVAEIEIIGTGFFAGESGALVTNRHVALPWEEGAGATALSDQDLEPVMTRFIAYLPGRVEAVPVEVLRASDSADLALLKRVDDAGPVPSLTLAAAPPAAGDEIIVMGYPTGLRSMLAQSGAAFIEELQKTGSLNFWAIAERLAAEKYIAPLASRGIVGHVTAEAVVYDAETTHGGSGGPVLGIDGAVVAVNTAILPEYGGSNLGVPAAKVRALLDEAGLR
jgi:S1-C subfamily serine protease